MRFRSKSGITSFAKQSRLGVRLEMCAPPIADAMNVFMTNPSE
jgi:hypothetical protein